jgi:acetate kinase
VKVLVFNCGSSSLKYRLISMPARREIAGGEAQRVGPPTTEPSRIIHRIDGREMTRFVPMADHAAAFQEVMKLLNSDSRLAPDAVGHRVVHGGARFSGHAIVNPDVVADLVDIQDMAPLHNPPATALVKACRDLYPSLPQVVVFDTAFHSTIPDYASTYCLPRKLTESLGIRKYGFHGTSHHYVAQVAAKMLGKPLARLNAVSCHLGSGGGSLCAIVNGASVDNTMGYSPLQGLIMSTRCGDLDPAVTLQLLVRAGGDNAVVEKQLNKKSGVLGMSGVSADIRDVLAGLDGGEDAPRMNTTAQIYLWRLRKYLGAYLTAVADADAVIFTDTIGETVPEVRLAVCADMEAFGLVIDADKNRDAAELPVDVAAPESRVRALVIATNEELAIAMNTYALLSQGEAA